jgi:RNA-directed DNA polymerase
MNGREGSDPNTVAIRESAPSAHRKKPTNKAGRPAAEPVQRRAGTEGNVGQTDTLRTQGRAGVTHGLDRVRETARARKKEKFTALLHHVTVGRLERAFFELKKDAAPGVDGVTWEDYERDLKRKLGDLHSRVHRGTYRATPSRRVYIPKPDGRQRPLAVAALEDKIVQRMTRWTRSASGSPASV